MDLDDQKFCVANQVKCTVALGALLRETHEDLVVNGRIFVIDFTGAGAKHLVRMNTDVQRKMNKIFQDSNPERVKGINFYNAGVILEAMMTIVRGFMKKKMQDRLQVHDTMESLYKVIPMELWPTEYLPDDYKGPSAGSIESVQVEMKKRLMEPKLRQLILESSDERYKIDESKRPVDPVPSESFRRLNID